MSSTILSTIKKASKVVIFGATGAGVITVVVGTQRYQKVKAEEANLPKNVLWSFPPQKVEVAEEHSNDDTNDESVEIVGDTTTGDDEKKKKKKNRTSWFGGWFRKNDDNNNALTPQSKSDKNHDKKKNDQSFANKKKKKQVVILGGGVVGITTAYKLALKGHSVLLVEPNHRPGMECSACAAGGMQKSNPVVDWGTWVEVTKSLAPFTRYFFDGWKGGKRSSHGDGDGDGGYDEKPYKFFHISFLSTLTDPFFLRWSSTFTKTSLFPCENQKYLQKEMLAFTEYAVDDMIEMMRDGKDVMAERSGFNPRGSLSLNYDEVVESKVATKMAGTMAATITATSAATPTATSEAVKSSNPTGGNALEPSKTLTGSQITATEPSILHQARLPTTAKFEYRSCAASSGRFTEELAERCASQAKEGKLDVTFLYDTKIKGVTVETVETVESETGGETRRITQLQTNRGIIPIPPSNSEVVLAAGAWTPHICALMGLYAPVYPLKGYAMSVSAQEVLKSDDGNNSKKEEDLPSRIVSDKFMYTSRLGDEIRITSIGEFSGWSTSPTPEVEKEFRREATRQFPQLTSYIQKAQVLCGHRPYVSDGILLLGRTDEVDNLLVSCGPGSNGWKLAMGSGEIVERLVSGKTEEEITKELGFDAMAFSPRGRVVPSPVFAKVCRARWMV